MILFLFIFIMIGQGVCSPLLVENNAQVKGLISPVKLTRLAVEGDRILEAFVSDDTLIIEKDERGGQLFLYPKEGALEASLTLLTEKGLTLDVALQVSEQAPASFILKSKHSSSPAKSPSSPKLQKSFSPMSSAEPFHKKILALMRDLYESKDHLEGGEDRTYSGFLTESIGHLSSGEFEGRLFKVTNLQKSSLSLKEMEFVRDGDIAAAFLQSLWVVFPAPWGVFLKDERVYP